MAASYTGAHAPAPLALMASHQHGAGPGSGTRAIPSTLRSLYKLSPHDFGRFRTLAPTASFSLHGAYSPGYFPSMGGAGRHVPDLREISAGPQRATLDAVAKAAGVGIATVDRVLNERGNVSLKTAQRVLAAARELHMKRILPDSHHRTLRLEVLLARPELPLISRMGQEFANLAQRIDRSVVIQRTHLKSDHPELMADRIRSSSADGIIVYAQSHPAILTAIDAATGAEKAVVTMISDIPESSRLAYAGIDHCAAGRTAGYFLARMCSDPGPILVLCNHFSFQSHEARVRGFTESLAEHAPNLVIAEVLEGHDDTDLSERMLLRAFRHFSDVAGIYNVGAANRAVAAVIQAGLVPRPPVFIGHELTPFTEPMLRDGTMTLTIDQNPEQQARFAVDVLMHHFGHAVLAGVAPPYRSDVPFTLYGPENLRRSDRS